MNIQFHDVYEENGKFIFDISYDNDFKRSIAKKLKRTSISDAAVKTFIVSVLNNVKVDDINVLLEELD